MLLFLGQTKRMIHQMMFSDWDFTPTRQGRYFKKVLQGYSE
jgi:hypothetical protein